MAAVLVVLTLFVVLPALAEIPAVKQRIDFNNQRQIDGGATFYTDQPFLESVIAERERTH